MKQAVTSAGILRGWNAAPFQIDTILPQQWAGHFASQARSGEHRLMTAILEDAIHDVQVYAGRRDARSRALFDAVAQWFASDATSYVYDVRNVCDVLGLDVDYVRRGLAQWLAAVHARPTLALVPPPPPWTVHRFRALRYSLQLTQKGIAERLGVATSTVASWEQWEPRDTLPDVYRVALDALEQGAAPQ